MSLTDRAFASTYHAWASPLEPVTVTPPAAVHGRNHAPTIWSAENVKLLHELVEQKLSASDIAKKMTAITGCRFTRNTIIGKTHRLSVELKGEPKPRKKSEVKPKKVRVPIIRPTAKLLPFFPAAPKMDMTEPLMLTILEVGHGQCRWPIAKDGKTFFCGHPVEGSRSWCPIHSKIGYAVPYVRQREPG